MQKQRSHTIREEQKSIEHRKWDAQFDTLEHFDSSDKKVSTTIPKVVQFSIMYYNSTLVLCNGYIYSTVIIYILNLYKYKYKHYKLLTLRYANKKNKMVTRYQYKRLSSTKEAKLLFKYLYYAL